MGMYDYFMNSPYSFNYLSKLGFKQLLRHLRGFHFSSCGFVLQTIFICPSHECNANCVHCYEKFTHEKFKHSLSTEQVKNIIDEFHKLNGYLVIFCSGEFIMREDALEILRYAHAKDLATAITTNGILLDEKKVDELVKAGVNSLFVSIDSANPERHDRLRGVPGCFEKAVRGIRLAKARGITTSIWTYISRSNSEEIEGIAKLGLELGVDGVYSYLPLLSGNFFNRFDENLTPEERNMYRKRFRYLPNLNFEFSSEKDICTGGGRYHVCVMPSGDVTFCPPVPYSYGNIHSKPLKDCVIEVRKDFKKFIIQGSCKGECPVNFLEYRKNCNAKFIYDGPQS